MILLIDNYDSFTYNVYQYIAELGANVEVVRNDAATLDELSQKDYEAVIISPGPGRPEDAGISVEAIRYFAGKKPVLGICLGHQAIGQVFGAKVVRAPLPIHGKTSQVSHNGTGIYAGMEPGFIAGRYHSLIVDKENLPDCLEITAEADGLIMGLKHKEWDVEGLQFHPESVLTPQGKKLLENFLGKLK
ncbi:MAG: aminodeoxychorismate/anthranilate synthase component II [Sporomusaceae bacterium]|nr:aminodeoxychorismate/anthranilate synthase component II [Sporomusaceae bacterium]